MKHIENTSIYTAEDGKLIVRKADDFTMGPSIDLGSADSIDNYEEKDFTEEEMKAFYENVGIPVHGEEEKPAPIEKGENNNKTEEE